MQEASACKAPPSSLADVCGFGGRVWHSDVLGPHCVCCLGPKRTWLLVLTSQCLLAHTHSRPSNSQNRSRSGYQDLSRFAIPWATHEQTGCKCLHHNPQTHPPALLGVQLQGGGWGQPDSFLLPGQVRPPSSFPQSKDSFLLFTKRMATLWWHLLSTAGGLSQCPRLCTWYLKQNLGEL